MSEGFEDKKKKMLIFILLLCFLLVALAFLYPYFRYEKSSISNTEILYDKFKKIVYLKNHLNASGEWVQTEFKDVMEAKCYLAERELEELLKENRENVFKRSSPKKLSNMVLTSSK